MFEEIIKNDMVYVDKTQHIHSLITNYSNVLLSRPKGFGKNLLSSTIKAIFEGRRSLFKEDFFIKGTDDLFWRDYDQKYAVIHLNFGEIEDFSSEEEFKANLNNLVIKEAKRHFITLPPDGPEGSLMELITTLAYDDQEGSKLQQQQNRLPSYKEIKKKVVILIDEYDDPVIKSSGKPYFKEVCIILEDFLTKIQGYDEFRDFTLLTGVSTLQQISSSIRGLDTFFNDLSYDSKYHNLFGFSEEELKKFYPDQIKDVARIKKIKEDEVLREIRDNLSDYTSYTNPRECDSVVSPKTVFAFFDAWDPFKAKKVSSFSPTPSEIILGAERTNIGPSSMRDTLLEREFVNLFSHLYQVFADTPSNLNRKHWRDSEKIYFTRLFFILKHKIYHLNEIKLFWTLSSGNFVFFFFSDKFEGKPELVLKFLREKKSFIFGCKVSVNEEDKMQIKLQIQKINFDTYSDQFKTDTLYHILLCFNSQNGTLEVGNVEKCEDGITRTHITHWQPKKLNLSGCLEAQFR